MDGVAFANPDLVLSGLVANTLTLHVPSTRACSSAIPVFAPILQLEGSAGSRAYSSHRNLSRLLWLPAQFQGQPFMPGERENAACRAAWDISRQMIGLASLPQDSAAVALARSVLALAVV